MNETGPSAGAAPAISVEARAGPRYLIVNADDFGRSEAINAGVIRAFEQGVVTSSSLMVRYPASPEAATYARSHRDLSLGLHLDLYEWVYEDGGWRQIYEVAPTRQATAVTAEVNRQLETYRNLVGQDPTHLDSHQHVHMAEPVVHAVVAEIAAELGLPLRRVTQGIHYSGDFYGQTGDGMPVEGAISVEGLLRILKTLPLGITELGCHPAAGDAPDSVYRAERERELGVLCDPRVRAAIGEEGIVLRSFHPFEAAPSEDQP